MNVLLVGTGQIGSRHLQSLANMPDAAIVAVDPFESSRKTAQERFDQVATSKTSRPMLTLQPDLPAGTQFDVGIIASDAKSRRSIVEKVVAAKLAKNLVLEKVLFTRLGDYSEVAGLFAKENVKAWVNCPMRMWPVYQEIRKSIMGPVRMSVSGSNWGLACNSVHYLDLFTYLSSSVVDRLETSALQRGSIPSKRSGYVELVGTWGGSKGEQSITLTSWRDGSSPVQVTIDTPDARYVIREDLQKYWLTDLAGGWAAKELPFPIPYQSQLTERVVRSLQERGSCELPDYETSAKVHRAVITAVLDHLKNSGEEVSECPIT